MQGLHKFAATVLLGVVGLHALAGGGANRVTVQVIRVAQIDNLDKFDVDPDRADFYALVKIGNGPVQKSKVMSDDDGRPYWTFTGTATARRVPIKISIMDDDGGLEEADDHVDICRKEHKKDISFVFDTVTGKVTGDVSGTKRGKIIYTQGGGDEDTDKGKLWFTVK